MNRIGATGRVVADAELKSIGSDQVLNFRLASDVGFGDKKTTNWFNCVIWGKRAETLCGYLTKGRPVTVFGSLQMREWTNKDGIKQLSPDIRIDDIDLLGGTSNNNAQSKTDKPVVCDNDYYRREDQLEGVNDDIPF